MGGAILFSKYCRSLYGSDIQAADRMRQIEFVIPGRYRAGKINNKHVTKPRRVT